MPKPRVLFLCTGNSARSQMAEAFLRHDAGDRFEAHSAGLEPRDIHPYTYKVMEEIGLDLGGHRSKSLDEYLGKVHFGYLITVCSNAERSCPWTTPWPTRGRKRKGWPSSARCATRSALASRSGSRVRRSTPDARPGVCPGS